MIEICTLCKDECTPYFYVNGHCCQDCYISIKMSRSKELRMSENNLKEDEITNKKHYCELNCRVCLPGWISAKERLPDFIQESGGLIWSEKVLIFLSDKTIQVMSYTNSGFWKNWEADISAPSVGITHWMPLPEVPNE